MIRLTFLLLVGLVGVLGQFSEYDSPLPPRPPPIPGAVPVGGGGRRPAFRSQARRLEGGAPPAPARGPARRLPPPPQPALEVGLAPRRLPTPPPLPPLEPVAPRRPSLPPRPVIEEEEDDESEAGTTLPPPTYRPAVFRPEDEFSSPPRPQIPEIDDIPIGINRQTSRPPIEVPSGPQPQQPPRLRPSPLAALRPAILEQVPQRVRPQEQPPQRISRPQPQEQPLQRVRPQPQEQPPQRTRPSYQEQSQRVRPSSQEQPQRVRPQPQEQQPVRPAPQRQVNRQQQVVQRPEKEYTKSGEPRPRKPTVQVLRKYREDNPDGSITWGFENDDGTFKEETIGVDCVTRGKYGYYDPDGVRREFSYSSGLPCKDRETQEENQEGYIDYTNNRYVLPNGDYVELNNMVKNRARKPVYRN